MTLLLFVIEPGLSLYSISFNVSVKAPSDGRTYMILCVFLVILVELACEAWDTKSLLLGRVAQKKNVRPSRVWYRFLPELYDVEINVLLAAGSFALSRDLVAFAWPIVSFLVSWLLHVWSEDKLKACAPQ
jgi:hypothetical protein